MGTVAGAVLTGGASRRMGSTKALVPERGVPLAERVARALHDGGCDPVFLVGGAVDDLAGLCRPFVAYLTPGSGPLGGVLSALAAASGAAVLVAACDLPALAPTTVARLLQSGGDVAIATSTRRHLLLRVTPAAGDVLGRHLAAGERSLIAAVAAAQSAGLDVVDVDVEEHEMRNVNTPGDLRE
ncbi:hypothetical protein BH24ACT6_BH24ACT6_18390 [soil metagenome]